MKIFRPGCAGACDGAVQIRSLRSASCVRPNSKCNALRVAVVVGRRVAAVVGRRVAVVARPPVVAVAGWGIQQQQQGGGYSNSNGGDTPPALLLLQVAPLLLLHAPPLLLLQVGAGAREVVSFPRWASGG